MMAVLSDARAPARAPPEELPPMLPTAPRSAPAAPDATRSARLVPLAVAALVLVLYLWWSLLQWHRWEVPSWDLGIFTQLARSYASGDGPLVPIKGHGYNLLGDHFHPILVLLAPVYALFPSALTLVVVQDVLVAVSVWVLARSAVRWLGTAPGAALGLAHGLSFGLQAAVAVQFHEIAFALPLLALALTAFVERRWTAVALWAAPVAFVKEDLGVTVAVLGLVLAWRAHREDGSRRPVLLGLALAVWGAAWSVLAVAVVLPALNPGGQFAYADRLDLGAALADPLVALLSLVVPAQKALTWLTVLLVGAGIALRSPLVLVALPTMLWRMLSPNHGYWGTEWHYSAVVMPVVFAALLDAVLRLRRSPRPGVRRLAGAGPWLALVVALLLVPGRPLGDLVDPAAYRGDPRAAVKAAVVAGIPKGSSVGTDLTLMHHLVPTTTVYWLGNEGDPPPEYVVVDQLGATWGGNPPADVPGWAEQHYGAPYTVVRDEEHLVVARRQG